MSQELEYVRELAGRTSQAAGSPWELRPPRYDEVDRLYDVYCDAFSTRTRELLDRATWLAKWPLDPACALHLSALAVSGAETAGYLLVDLDASRPNEAAIAQLGVRVSARRRGLGRALLLHALDGFARSGLALASLRVAPDNLDAIRVYEALGFRRR